MTLDDALALLDAGLTVISAVAMIGAYRAVRRKDIPRHRTLMLVALAASTLFMATFVYRFASFGFREFAGEGWVRVLYLILFFSHEPIAVINIPLVVAAVVLAWRGNYDIHREVARMAFPIWLYASLSGIAIYVLLVLTASRGF